MKLLFPLFLVFALAGCSGQSEDASKKPEGPSQIEAVTFGLGSQVAGERLYGRECAFCHVGKNTGTMMLKRRLEQDQPAQLHERKDLSAEYIKAVVRNGMMNMPPITRADLTDEELDALSEWLAKGNP